MNGIAILWPYMVIYGYIWPYMVILWLHVAIHHLIYPYVGIPYYGHILLMPHGSWLATMGHGLVRPWLGHRQWRLILGSQDYWSHACMRSLGFSFLSHVSLARPWLGRSWPGHGHGLGARHTINWQLVFYSFLRSFYIHSLEQCFQKTAHVVSWREDVFTHVLVRISLGCFFLFAKLDARTHLASFVDFIVAE